MRLPSIIFSSAAAAVLSLACLSSASAQDAEKLCGSRTPGRVNVAVRSLLLTSGAEPSAKSLEVVFSGVIVGRLGSTAGVNAVFWDVDDRRFFGVRPQMDALLAGGGTGRNKRGERASAELASFLSAQNCDYFVGGQLSRDSKVLIATPFIFDVAERELVDDVSPVIQEVVLPPNGVAEALAQQFVLYIRGKRPSRLQEWVQVGCFARRELEKGWREISPNDEAFVEQTLDGIQRQFAVELREDPRFSERVQAPKEIFCTQPDSKEPSRAVATFGGSIRSREGRFGLRITANVADSSGGAFDVSLSPDTEEFFFLKGTSREEKTKSSDYGAVRDAVAKLKRIISAATTAEGVIFPGRQQDLPVDLKPLLVAFNSRLESARNEEALTLAFKALAQDKRNPIALVTAARAYMAKGDMAAGGAFLTASLTLRDKLPGPVLGDFLESAGNAYKSIGLNDPAVKFLLNAADAFRSQGRDRDASRAIQSVAFVLLKVGRVEEARRYLLPWAEGKNDPEALLAIAQADLASGNIQSAEQWLRRGQMVSASDARFASGLALTNRLLGTTALQQGEYSDAAQYFEQSLIFAENGEALYLSGIAASRAGKNEQAIGFYEKLLSRPDGPDYSRWAESAWLNVLECYLLTRQWDAVLSRGTLAIQSALMEKKDAQLVVLYLQAISAALKDPSQSAESWTASPQHRSYVELRQFVSPSKLEWSNDAIEAFVRDQQQGNQGLLGSVRELARDFTAATTAAVQATKR